MESFTVPLINLRCFAPGCVWETGDWAGGITGAMLRAHLASHRTEQDAAAGLPINMTCPEPTARGNRGTGWRASPL